MSAAPPAPRVLLVDDNQGFRHELRLLLEDCGIEVVAEGENGPAGGRAGVQDRRRRGPDGPAHAGDGRPRGGPGPPRPGPGPARDHPVRLRGPGLKSEAAAANTSAYLVKGCSGGLVLDTIEQAFQATRP